MTFSTGLNFSLETLRKQAAFLSTIKLIASCKNNLSSSSPSFIDYLQYISLMYICMMCSPIDYTFLDFLFQFLFPAPGCQGISKAVWIVPNTVFFVSEMSHLGFGKTATEYFEEVARLHHCRTFTLKKSLSIATFVTFQTGPECSAHLFVISRLKFPSTKIRNFSITQCSHFPLRRCGLSHSHSTLWLAPNRLRVA